jgi:hypothetical protein
MGTRATVGLTPDGLWTGIRAGGGGLQTLLTAHDQQLRPRRSPLRRSDGVETPLAWDALELVGAAIVELES